jgi:glutaredoxin
LIVLRALALLTVVAALLIPTAGCGDQPDHFARALAIERELHRQAPDAGAEHHRYVTVLKELRRIPRGHRDRPKANAMEQRIRDGRRLAVARKYPQLKSLPARLSPATAPDPHLATASDPPATGLDVVLYSTAWCGYCRKARTWLTSNGIPFVEKDIEKDRAANAEYQRLGRGYSGVPLISVNGTVFRGFDARAVRREVDRVLKGS